MIRRTTPVFCLSLVALLAGLFVMPLALRSVPVAAGDETKGGGSGDGKKAPDPKEMRTLLKQAVLAGDETQLSETVRRIARLPGPEPARAILAVADSLNDEEETLYWFLLGGVCGVRAPEGYSEIGEFVVKHRADPIARDLMSALQQQANKHKYFNRVVRRVLEWGSLDLQLMAIDLCAQIPARRSVDVLIEFMGRAEEAKKPLQADLLEHLVYALEGLTLQSFGPTYINWQGWWEVNRHKGLGVLRLEAERSESMTRTAQPLDPVRAREFAAEQMPPGKVLVIKGPVARTGNDMNFDHIEEVLSRLHVPHVVVEKTRVADKSFSLDEFAAIFMNCTQIHPFCQSPGHQAGSAVGNRLHQCLGPNPHDTAHYGWWCGLTATEKASGGDACRLNQCGPEHPSIQKVKKWVEAGGYLFTEDWMLIEILEAAWPKMVVRGHKIQPERQVKIQPAKGIGSHALLRGVFVPPVNFDDYEFEDEDAEEEYKKNYNPADEDDLGDVDEGGPTAVAPEDVPQAEEVEAGEVEQIEHHWKIDDESHAIDVKSDKVTTLIISNELKKDCGNNQKAVAITFQAGKGRVLHVLSHFGKQSSSQNEATIENLLINWLMEVHVVAQ